MPQGRRNRVLQDLRLGRMKVLVATDVAARGIDVPTITHVINYGLPMKAEDYVHRIGRTGRAGREGLAVTLAVRDDVSMIRRIQQFTTQTIPVAQIEGLEPKTQEPRIFPPRPAGAGGYEDRGPRQGYANKSGFNNKSFGSKPFHRDGAKPAFNRDGGGKAFGRDVGREGGGNFAPRDGGSDNRGFAPDRGFSGKPFEHRGGERSHDRSFDNGGERGFAPRGDRPAFVPRGDKPAFAGKPSFGAGKPSFGGDRPARGPGGPGKRPAGPSAGPRRGGFGR